MALPNMDHPTGTNLNSQDSEPVTEDLFVLIVVTLVTNNKAVHIGAFAQYKMHFQPLGPNAKWNNRKIHTILDTSQGKESYHLINRNTWLPLKVLHMRRKLCTLPGRLRCGRTVLLQYEFLTTRGIWKIGRHFLEFHVKEEPDLPGVTRTTDHQVFCLWLMMTPTVEMRRVTHLQT